MHKPGHRGLASNFEQNKSAGDVGLDYRSWFVDAPVDVRLCGKMNDSITATHCRFYGCCIADVPLHKFIIGMVRYRFKIRDVSSVRELVIVDNRQTVLGSQGTPNKVGTNKSSAAGNKNPHRAAS